MRKLVYYDGHTHTLLEDSLEKVELAETSMEEILKLVDIENDLAVARAFYDEIEEALKKNPNATKDTIETSMSKSKDKEELEEEEKRYKEQKNNIIEIAEEPDINTPKNQEGAILTENNVSALESSQAIVSNNTQPTIAQQEPVQAQTESTQVQTEPVQVESQIQEPIVENTRETPTIAVEDKPEELETFNNDTIVSENDSNEVDTSQPLAIDEIPQEIETLDNNENIETFDEKKNETLESLDNIINSLDKKEDNQIESLDTEPVLSNPLKEQTEQIETLDDINKQETPINYDQMIKIPFVDETVDL